MNITKITILDFGVNERGEQFVKIEFEPLIGDSKEVKIVVLRKGDTLTTDAPIVEDAGNRANADGDFAGAPHPSAYYKRS